MGLPSTITRITVFTGGQPGSGQLTSLMDSDTPEPSSSKHQRRSRSFLTSLKNEAAFLIHIAMIFQSRRFKRGPI